LDPGNQHARPQRTAFVLAGGGSLGAVQVGMIRALFERGITLPSNPNQPGFYERIGDVLASLP